MGRQNVRQKVIHLAGNPGSPGCVHFTLTLAYHNCFLAFPEDDRLEYDLHAEEKRHDQIQATLNSESRAAENLARAVRFMDACQSSMQEALGYSRYGPFHSYCAFPLHYLLTSGIDLKICGEVESAFYTRVLESHSIFELMSFLLRDSPIQYYGRYDGKKCISKCARQCFSGRDACEPSYSSISSGATYWTN